MHPPSFSSRLLLLTAILLATSLGCNIGQTEQKAMLFDQYYRIEPSTLLSSLGRGETNAFTPVSDAPGSVPVHQQAPVPWLQADYLQLAHILFRDVLDKPIHDWHLKSMDFQTSCTLLDRGFQNGRFEFFMVRSDKNQESRFVRFVDVDPRGNFVNVMEWRIHPNLLSLNAIDLVQLKIPAETALQIAEASGGQQQRRAVANACNIFVGLFPNSASYRGWIVIYTRSQDNSALFRIYIDPGTGEPYSVP